MANKTTVPFFSRGYISSFKKPSFILQLAVKEDNEPVRIQQGIEAVMTTLPAARRFVKDNYGNCSRTESLMFQLEQLAIATTESPDKMNYLNDLFEATARLEAAEIHWLTVFKTRCPDWKTWRKLPIDSQKLLLDECVSA